MTMVNSQSGNKVKDTDKPFILVLKQGENLFEAILRCADEANIKSASINGLGGLEEVGVAYYDLNSKEYHTKIFSEMHELISLNGNITFSEGKRFLHIHAAIGNESYDVFGGHIMSARVNPSAEITVIPLSEEIHRAYDGQTGLKLMCGIESAKK